MKRTLRDPFDRDKFYLVDGDRMERVRKVVLRLYEESRWLPDEQRDTAQMLEWAVLDAEMYREGHEDNSAEWSEWWKNEYTIAASQAITNKEKAEELAATVDSLREDNARQRRCRADEQRIADLHAERVDLRVERAGLEIELAAVLAERDRLRSQLAELRGQLADAKDEAASYREANESASVCQRHIEEFTGGECLVCQRDRLQEEFGQFQEAAQFWADGNLRSDNARLRARIVELEDELASVVQRAALVTDRESMLGRLVEMDAQLTELRGAALAYISERGSPHRTEESLLAAFRRLHDAALANSEPKGDK